MLVTVIVVPAEIQIPDLMFIMCLVVLPVQQVKIMSCALFLVVFIYMGNKVSRAIKGIG